MISPRLFLHRPLLLLLLLSSEFLASCNTLKLSRAAGKTGAVDGLRDASSLAGTYANKSAEPFGQSYMRLWELLKGRMDVWDIAKRGAASSGETDQIRISAADPGFLNVARVSKGAVRETVRVPYSLRGNHLHLRHSREFGLLPLGYAKNSSDVALAATQKGGLVALHRYDSFAISTFFGGVSSAGTHVFRFPRVP